MAGVGHEIRSSKAISIAEKDALVSRREDLMAGLRGAEVESVRRRVAKLFGMMPVWGLDAESASDTVSDYAKVLSSQPIWAIDAACISIFNSGAKFRPGAPEFLALARKAADPFRAELHDVKSTLDARVYREPDPTERQRVLARFASIAKDLTVNLDMAGAVKRVPVEAPQIARERLAEGFSHLQAPLTVSDRLRAQNRERAVEMARAMEEGR